jgi:hypothetical protein
MLYLSVCCWSTFSLTVSQPCKLLPFFLHQLLIPRVTSVFLSRHIRHMLLDRQLRDKFSSLKYIKGLTFSESGGNMNWSLFFSSVGKCLVCELRYFGLLRSKEYQFLTDVSGQHIGLILKRHEIMGPIVCPEKSVRI